MLPDDYSALIQARHSIRDFRPDAVPGEVLDGILDDARHAPSWSNTRPYCVAVATGERLDRLREGYVAAFDASLPLQHRKRSAMVKAVLTGTLPDGDFKTWGRYPDDLRPRSVKVGVGLYQHLGIERGDREARDAQSRRNCEFFGAPVVLWMFVHDQLLPFSAHDAGLMLQTLMLAAQARGVDSCALGVLTTWRGPVEAEFTIPPHYKLITGLALGYASDDPVNDFRAEHPPLQLLDPR
ncbi:MAG: nitroreductase [Propionibacteriales bacterium]|nr:nitroreductase [Propionibacteriales bacterium]